MKIAQTQWDVYAKTSFRKFLRHNGKLRGRDDDEKRICNKEHFINF